MDPLPVCLRARATVQMNRPPVSLSAQCCLAAFVLLALSDWWTLALLYAGWLWLDWDTPVTGGRRCQWIRTWRIWDCFRDYFPLTVSSLPSVVLISLCDY